MSQCDLSLIPVLNLASPYSPEVSRANHSAPPGSKEARSMTAISGRKCCELLRSCNQLGSLEKTLLESSEWNSTIVSLAWRISGTPAGRSIFQLAAWEPSTDVQGCLLFPTLQTTDAHGYQRDPKTEKKRLTIPGIIALIPTLGSVPRGAHKMREIVGKRCISKTTGEKWSLCLEEWIYLSGKDAIKTPLKLQPAFAEWMMGFPIGYTDLPHLEMPSSRSKSIRSSKRLRILKGVV